MSRKTAKLINNEQLLIESETMSIKELSDKYNVNYTTIFNRLHKNTGFIAKKGRPPKFKID